MVRRLGLGKNNHLTYASLALSPRYAFMEDDDGLAFSLSTLFKSYRDDDKDNNERLSAIKCHKFMS